MFLLGDMLSRIQNGLLLRRHSVLVLRSRFCLEVLKVLYKEGFISGYAIHDSNFNLVIVFLKYINNKPVFKGFKLLSSPSRHLHVTSRRLRKFFLNSGVYVISTSNYGLISTTSFTNSNLQLVGGEVLFQILY